VMGTRGPLVPSLCAALLTAVGIGLVRKGARARAEAYAARSISVTALGRVCTVSAVRRCWHNAQCVNGRSTMGCCIDSYSTFATAPSILEVPAKVAQEDFFLGWGDNADAVFAWEGLDVVCEAGCAPEDKPPPSEGICRDSKYDRYHLRVNGTRIAYPFAKHCTQSWDQGMQYDCWQVSDNGAKLPDAFQCFNPQCLTLVDPAGVLADMESSARTQMVVGIVLLAILACVMCCLLAMCRAASSEDGEESQAAQQGGAADKSQLL